MSRGQGGQDTDSASAIQAAQAAADAAAAAAKTAADAAAAAAKAAADASAGSDDDDAPRATPRAAVSARTGTPDRRGNNADDDGRSEDLRDSPMMAHLLDALGAGTDIGHYGRLTFAMVARHFMDEDELIALLAEQPDHDEAEMRAMLSQVEGRDYNPPKRERILQWQAEQDFPICPTPDDPDSCNVYRELRFPDSVYDNISEYHTQREHQEG